MAILIIIADYRRKKAAFVMHRPNKGNYLINSIGGDTLSLDTRNQSLVIIGVPEFEEGLNMLQKLKIAWRVI